MDPGPSIHLHATVSTHHNNRMCLTFHNDAVVFCPPVPQWDEADYNSTDNSFLAVVSYKCHTNFSFEDSKDLADGQNVEKISTCLEIKVWDPPFDDCVRESITNVHELN